MADSKGTDPNKPGDIKPAPDAGTDKTVFDPKPIDAKPAAAKSAAVKPPVLDLKARDASAETGKPDPAKPADKTDAKPAFSTAAKPDTKPSARPGTATPRSDSKPASGGFAFGAALAGGVVGLAAAYGLAALGYWPAAPQPSPAADPRLAQFATAIPELETVTETTQSELATLNQRVATLEQAEPAEAATASAPPAADLSGIEADIAALGQRVDALANQPTAQTDSADVTGELATLRASLDELGARVGTTEAGLRSLDTTVSQTSATLAAQPTDIGAVLQLPLVLSSLETAFANGRPFATELAALRAAAPDTQVPATIGNAATTGLPRPDTIVASFETALPSILASRPADPDAQWQDGALDWFRSAVALRPTGELEGDSPEAIASRLEAAVTRRDWATANQLMAQLPEPMRNAAGDVAAQIAAQADATQLLDAVRAKALASEATP